jgi:hypothetical protein
MKASSIGGNKDPGYMAERSNLLLSLTLLSTKLHAAVCNDYAQEYIDPVMN